MKKNFTVLYMPCMMIEMEIAVIFEKRVEKLSILLDLTELSVIENIFYDHSHSGRDMKSVSLHA